MAMYPKNMIFTSESVTEGHPDKFCDKISDAVLDECLRHDPMSRVACETYVTMGLVNVGGEITTKALFDVAKVVREVGNEIGYTSPEYGFTAAYGHFGRKGFAWERVDATDELLAKAKRA